MTENYIEFQKKLIDALDLAKKSGYKALFLFDTEDDKISACYSCEEDEAKHLAEQFINGDRGE